MSERSNLLIKKKFNEYLIPTIMTSMAVSLASVVDGVIVGNLLGDTALAAVGLAGPVIYGINMIFLLFAVGGVSCASIAIGRRDNKSANHLFTLSLLAGVLLLILYAVVLLGIIEPLSNLLAQGNPQLQDLTAAYIKPLVFVGPPLMISLSLAQFWRADGSPKASAMVSIVANIINLIFDYVLIRYFNAGIMGAGISTALGYCMGILVVMPYLFSKKRTFKFVFPKRENLKELVNIIRVGSSKALTQGMSLLRSIVLNGIIVFALGSLGMSAMTVCLNALMIAGIFIGGTSDALLPIVGNLYGEGDHFGVSSVVKTAYKVLIAACLGVMVFFIFFPQVMGGLFGITDPEGLSVLIPALRMYALSLPFYGINQLLQNFYATTGREKLASTMAVLDGFVFVVSFAFLLLFINAEILWLCYLCAEISTILAVGLIARKIRGQGNISHILLLNLDKEKNPVFDTTILPTFQAAAELSKEVIRFCEKNGVSKISANRMGVAVEEMAVNTIVYSKDKKLSSIDILLRLMEESLVLRFRDDGPSFDPTVYKKEENQFSINSIEMIKHLAFKIDYARQLGFNTTLISFDTKALN